MSNNGNAHELELPAVAAGRHLITLLTGIYLEAGLPLEFAVKSALADYKLFQDELLCAS